jgi:hypothetical protein
MIFDEKDILGNKTLSSKYGDRDKIPTTLRLGKVAFVLDKNKKIVLEDNYLKCLFYVSQRPHHEYTVELLRNTIPSFEQNLKNSKETIQNILNNKVIFIDLIKESFDEAIICEDSVYSEILPYLPKDIDGPISPEILDRAAESLKNNLPEIKIIFLDDGENEEEAINSKIDLLSNSHNSISPDNNSCRDSSNEKI